MRQARRQFLSAAFTAGVAGLAGCTGLNGQPDYRISYIDVINTTPEKHTVSLQVTDGENEFYSDERTVEAANDGSTGFKVDDAPAADARERPVKNSTGFKVDDALPDEPRAYTVLGRLDERETKPLLSQKEDSDVECIQMTCIIRYDPREPEQKEQEEPEFQGWISTICPEPDD